MWMTWLALGFPAREKRWRICSPGGRPGCFAGPGREPVAVGEPGDVIDGGEDPADRCRRDPAFDAAHRFLGAYDASGMSHADGKHDHSVNRPGRTARANPASQSGGRRGRRRQHGRGPADRPRL